jgi:hypothetical protein
MTLFVVHPWAQFFAGVITGCWIGAIIACAGLLLLVGRRVRQLESINQLLRTKLKVRIRPQRTGTGKHGPTLVMPMPGAARKVEVPPQKIARVN